ncbi:MAG TPA: S-layer homology domain-containing protein, partial [Chloroflexia bacterium]
DSPPFLSTLFGYFQDLRTDVNGVQPSGVYSSVVGTAPNRQYVLRWHATYFGNASNEVDFEVVMNENSPTISVIYGQVPANANDAGVGIQLNDGQYTQFSCSGNPPLTAGLRVDYVPVSCNAPTATVTPQNTPTATQTSVPLATQTSVPGTATATATPVNCPLPFTDVDQFNPFYQYIQCLYCRGIISGYSDNTFRWGNDVTRGQVSKIIANSAGLNDTVSGQTFTDVDAANPFYVYIERLYQHGFISGYDTAANCPTGTPCFRWELPVTRGQLAKIDANAAGYNETPTGQTFRDVPAANPFYVFIERLSLHGVISGYDCGGPGEPCPGLYYRPFNNITRGQVSKVASQTFFPNSCAPAATRP